MNDTQKLLLNIVGAVLFGGEIPEIDLKSIDLLLDESKSQTVFPLVFSAVENQIKNSVSEEKYAEYSQLYFVNLTASVCNFAEHGELHKLMSDNDVSYTIIKGIASAMYYETPALRSVGDVDVLVGADDFEKVGCLIESLGFTRKSAENDGVHIAYKRPPISIWELHKQVNGIPNNVSGKLIAEEMGKAIQSAKFENIDGTTCMVPDKFHHGLIMLLHIISHLTGEGIGLRHLCDWVVYISSIDDDEFISVFECKLKEYGLWKLAKVLTLLGVKYLNAPLPDWLIEPEDEEIIEALMEDILNGGNFGFKDMNRYREIKYISDRGDGTVKQGGIVSQGFVTLNQKVLQNYKFIDRFRLLLPFGWVIEICKYFGLLMTGKRKSSDTKKMLTEAKKRKNLYSSLGLFEVNN